MNTLPRFGRAAHHGFAASGRLRLFTYLAVLLSGGGTHAASAQGFIFVTTTADKISATGGCSLQEAIYSANFDSNVAVAGYNEDRSPIYVTTQCRRGNGSDRIILPIDGHFNLDKVVQDASNPFGATATPMVSSTISIEANGSTLAWTGTGDARAFSVGAAGNLTLRDIYVRDFRVRGGGGGGGGGGQHPVASG